MKLEDLETMGKAEQILFDFAEELTKDDILKTASPKTVDRLLASFRGLSEKEIKDFTLKLEPKLRKELMGAYKDYVRNGYKKYAPDIRPYRLNEIKKDLRKQVEQTLDNSLALITTQEKEFMNKLQDRFRNWATIPSPDLRGKKGGIEKALKEQLGEVSTKHQQFIITDQTRKMIGNFNEVLAKEAGAIAFKWRNRRDKRVVGNPAGLYPKGSGQHENHWKREGKIYLLSNSWAYKRGYVKATKDIIIDREIDDGVPSVAIGCRCYAEYIFDVEKLPSEVLTDKGKEYIIRMG